MTDSYDVPQSSVLKEIGLAAAFVAVLVLGLFILRDTGHSHRNDPGAYSVMLILVALLGTIATKFSSVRTRRHAVPGHDRVARASTDVTGDVRQMAVGTDAR